MILADASVWIEHLRAPIPRFHTHLDDGEIACHDFVIGELALGHVRNRDAVLAHLAELVRLRLAEDTEVLSVIRRHRLFGKGIGYVDAHLLVSALLTEGSVLWTRDRNLAKVARSLNVETMDA